MRKVREICIGRQRCIEITTDLGTASIFAVWCHNAPLIASVMLFNAAIMPPNFNEISKHNGRSQKIRVQNIIFRNHILRCKPTVIPSNAMLASSDVVFDAEALPSAMDNARLENGVNFRIVRKKNLSAVHQISAVGLQIFNTGARTGPNHPSSAKEIPAAERAFGIQFSTFSCIWRVPRSSSRPVNS